MGSDDGEGLIEHLYRLGARTADTRQFTASEACAEYGAGGGDLIQPSRGWSTRYPDYDCGRPESLLPVSALGPRR
jgi:hypothetical protein